MVASSQTCGTVEAETGIVGRDKVEPNNTCRGFNSSSTVSHMIIIGCPTKLQAGQ